MWYLTSEHDNRVIYFVPGCEEITIGRSTDYCRYPILQDQSISRKHAIISLCGEDLVIQDLGSRYNTRLNDSETPLKSGEKVVLKACDVIHFGRFKSIWVVNKIDLVSCSSTLKREHFQNLTECLAKLGGIYKNDIDQTCTYLTMPTITVTIKIVLALVQGLHIVTPDYWDKCCEAVRSNVKLPDPNLYQPKVVEPTVNTENVTFLPDNKRKHVFKDKTFVFFSKKQYDTYNAVIVNAEGTAALLSESKFTKSSLCASNMVVIQCMTNNTTQESNSVNQVNDIINYLKARGKRAVPDVEIGLAVLYGSTDIHCNPDFNVATGVVKGAEFEQATKATEVLAIDTQDVDVNKHKYNVVIDESLTANDSDMERSNKRKLSTEDSMENVPPKRMAIDNASTNDDDLFNFGSEELNPENNKSNVESAKKLNFTKPQKRKAECADDDDFFNFLPDSCEISGSATIKTEVIAFEGSSSKKPRLQENEKPIRGIKVHEIADKDSTWKTSSSIKVEVKEENMDEDDLGNRMRKINLGTTIVEIKDDLIIKEIPTATEVVANRGVTNFKKFKKVWPVRMQIESANTNILSEVY